MNNFKLAVIIPFFKLDFFEDTLNSLASQTNLDFNVYIGNDASPQDPADLITKYADKINLHYQLFDNNLGSQGLLVEQWKRCISLSKDEDWLMILADDDYLSSNFVEELYKAVEDAKTLEINLLRFKMRRVTDINEFLVDLEQPNLYNAVNYVWEDETHERFISISENVFSRKIYNQKSFRNYPLAWRVPMMMYMDFTQGGPILGVNTAYVVIRRSNQQLTRRKDLDNYKRISMGLFYFDILNEYHFLFKDFQNLKFLKVYQFYSAENKLKHSYARLFLKYGSTKELLKYFVKKIIS